MRLNGYAGGGGGQVNGASNNNYHALLYILNGTLPRNDWTEAIPPLRVSPFFLKTERIRKKQRGAYGVSNTPHTNLLTRLTRNARRNLIPAEEGPTKERRDEDKKNCRWDLQTGVDPVTTCCSMDSRTRSEPFFFPFFDTTHNPIAPSMPRPHSGRRGKKRVCGREVYSSNLTSEPPSC